MPPKASSSLCSSGQAGRGTCCTPEGSSWSAPPPHTPQGLHMRHRQSGAGPLASSLLVERWLPLRSLALPPVPSPTVLPQVLKVRLKARPPPPQASGTFAPVLWIRIRSRIRSDPELFAGSGSGSGINHFGSGSGFIPNFSVNKSHFFNQIAQKIGIFTTYLQGASGIDARFLKLSPASAVDHDKIFTVYPPLHLLLSTGVHLLAKLKGL
jgi:hypothetical protein